MTDNVECALDRKHTDLACTHARPGAFKSWFAVERYGHTAHLKIDYDLATNQPRARDWRLLKVWLGERLHHVDAVRVYTTRKGLHVRVWLYRCNFNQCTLTDSELCDATVLVNDDPWRIRFNRSRVRRGVVGWLVLWTEKWKDGKKVSWEVYDAAWTETVRRWLGLAGGNTRKRSVRSKT